MSTTKTQNGLLTFSGTLTETLTGDNASQGAQASWSIANALSNLNLDGWLCGTLTITDGNFGRIYLAHPTDPCGSFGNSKYNPGFVPDATTQCAFLGFYFESTTLEQAEWAVGTTPYVAISIPSDAGFNCFGHNALDVLARMGPGDVWFNTSQIYGGNALVTSASNDNIYLQASSGSGTCTLKVYVGYRNGNYIP